MYPIKATVATVILVLTSLIGWRVSAQSDGQSVDGAQKFLSMVLPGIEVKPGDLTRFIETDYEFDPRRRRYVTYTGAATVTNASSVSTCVTNFTYYAGAMWRTSSGPDRRTHEQLKDRHYYLKRELPVLGTMSDRAGAGHVQWGEVVLSAKASGTSVEIKARDLNYTTTLYLKDEALAKRVAYAIEYLRMNCDLTASTGF